MIRNLCLLSCLVTIALPGCGVAVDAHEAPVDVSGKLTMNGKPVDAVNINFQPTAAGLPAVIPVTNGAFAAKMTPGKYTYFLTAGKSPKSLDRIPRSFQEGSMDRQLEIDSNETLVLTIP